MAEYIEREALVRKLKKLFTQEVLEDATTQEIARGALMFVENEPTADVTDVRHGNWEDKVRKGFGAFSGRCSKCKKYSGIWVGSKPYRFCPYCGAKMDLE